MKWSFTHFLTIIVLMTAFAPLTAHACWPPDCGDCETWDEVEEACVSDCGECESCGGSGCESNCESGESCVDGSCMGDDDNPCEGDCCEDSGGGGGSGGGAPGGDRGSCGIPGLRLPPDIPCPPGSPGGGSGSGGSGGATCPTCPAATSADPVFLKNGEFRYSYTDFVIDGPIPIKWTRTYGSRRKYNGRFGYGWDVNFNLRIKTVDSETIALVNGTGCLYKYDEEMTDTYVRPENPREYIKKNANGTYTRHITSGLEYDFDSDGYLTGIEDQYSNTVSITRHFTDHYITTITDALGRDIDFDYNTNGLLESITDFTNRSWIYTYDANGNLEVFTMPATDDFSNGLSVTYDYDSLHNMTQIQDPNSDVFVENTYNALDKVETQTINGDDHDMEYDAQTKVATITDREGHIAKIYYNDFGGIEKRVVYTDDPTDDPNQFVTEYLYNTAGRVTRTIYPEGNCVDYAFNTDGFTTAIYRKTSPDDPNTASDPNVIAILYAYVDSADALLSSKVDKVTDPEGNETDYDYNNEGLVTKVTMPTVNTPSGSFSTVYEYTYTASGDSNTVKDPNGVITKYEYYDTSSSDPNSGMLHKVIVDYGMGNYLNLTTEYAYDALRRVRTVYDPNGNATTLTYNDLDQLEQVENALGYITKFSYDYNGNRNKIEKETSDTANPWQITEFTYNTWSKLTKVTDALDNETAYGYDKLDRRDSVTNAFSEQSSYTYNERGLLTKVTDPNSGETTYTYDDNGNRLTVTDPNGMTTAYAYDGFGRVIKITDAEGHYRTKEYDKNGRVIKEIADDDGDTALMQSRYAYNAAGDLIQYAVMADTDSTAAVDPNDDMVTKYGYAWANGPMLEETKYYGGHDTTDSTAAVTYHDYDVAGRRITTEDPDGNTTDYWYDENGRVTRIQKIDTSTVSGSNDTITMTTDFEYDAIGQLVKRIEKPNNPDASSDSSWQMTEYEYDKLGNRTEETRPNDVEVAYEYDLLGRKTMMSVDPADANQVTEYGYDAIGRQVWIAGYTDDTDANTKQRTDYSYDDLGRITKITYPDDATIEYAYNEAGKVISRTDQRGIVTYYDYDDTYSMIEKVVTMDSVTTTESFTYDGLGRMLTAVKVEGATTISDSEFGYNDMGCITDAYEDYTSLDVDLVEKHIEYSYDNAGFRIKTDYPVSDVSVDRTNDWSGRIDTIVLLDVITVADYEYIGSRAAARDYSYSTIGVNTEYSYDNLGRATNIYTYIAGSPDTTVVDFDYDYVNNENNIWKKQFDHRDSDPYNEYEYDDLDRLTIATYIDDANEVFTMDDLGNRANVNLRSGTDQVYHVDPLTNRYIAVDGPLAQWKLDETSGTTADDSIGSNDGSITDAQWSDGLINGGLDFVSTINQGASADGDLVQIDDFSDEIEDSDFTVAWWINPDAVNVVKEMILLGTAYNAHDFEFYQYYDDLRIRTNSSSTPVLTVADIFTAQTWTHLCITADYYLDEADEKIDLTVYVDGVSTAPATGLVNTWNQYDLNIGTYPNREWGFNGEMDEVQVFDAVLTDAQAYALYKSETGNLIDYDAAGNMTSDKDGYLYSYDYENRTVKIEKGDGDATPTTVAEFAYDALGRRIMKTDSIASETRYYYYNDQWQALAEYDASNTMQAYTVYGNYIDETLFRVDLAGTYAYVYAHDHLYSTVAICDFDATDSTGIVERCEYDAYGNVHVLDADFSDDADGLSDVGNPYTFTGRRLDVLDSGDLDISYYRHRYYNPEIGRFMTHDPLGIVPTMSKIPLYPSQQYRDGLNVYQYVVSCPTAHLDPDGRGLGGLLWELFQWLKTLRLGGKCADAAEEAADKRPVQPDPEDYEKGWDDPQFWTDLESYYEEYEQWLDEGLGEVLKICEDQCETWPF